MAARSTKVYVGNVPETSVAGDIRALFEEYGVVTECDIVKDFAFVHFKNSEDAKKAVAALQNTEFEGSKLKVEMSTSKPKSKEDGEKGSGSECYKCGKRGHWARMCRAPDPDDRFLEDDLLPPMPRHSRLPPPRRRPEDMLLRPPPPFPDPYRDPYRDPLREAYEELKERYRALESRVRPYPSPYERRLPPARDPYSLSERDPYSRPPPDYYRGLGRDPYYDLYYRRRYPLSSSRLPF